MPFPPGFRSGVIVSPAGNLVAGSLRFHGGAGRPLAGLFGRQVAGRHAARPRAVVGGRVRQTIIEMEAAFLFVSAAGQGTCLAVLSTGDADIGLVAYEMAVLVRRSNEHLAVAARSNGHQQSYPPQYQQPPVAPAPDSVYAPYPTPAGSTGPAPHTE